MGGKGLSRGGGEGGRDWGGGGVLDVVVGLRVWNIGAGGEGILSSSLVSLTKLND